MADEPNETDNLSEETLPGTQWLMPEPVYCSTPGRTPKSLAARAQDEIDTEMPSLDTLDITLDQSQELANAKTEESLGPSVAAVEAAKRGGCLSSFLFILSALGAFAAVVLLILFYFLFYYRPAETGTF